MTDCSHTTSVNEKCGHCAEDRARIAALESRLAEALQVLKFYADEGIYIGYMAPGSPTGFKAEIDNDNGEKARAFLRKGEHRG